MSIFGDLSGIGDALSGEGDVAYARGAIIQAGVLGGASANQTLAVLQSVNVGDSGATLGFNRANFLQVWKEAQAQVLPAQRAGSLAFDTTTGEILPGAPPPDWTGQVVHQVSATWRTKETDGSYSIQSKPYGVIAPGFLSPADAIDAAMDIISTPMSPDEAERYPSPSDILSLSLTGAWYRTNPNWSGGL
jgi:hypothetical protein